MDITIDLIKDRINNSIEIKKKLLNDSELLKKIYKACEVIIKCFDNPNGKVMLAGNGGSAADAQHLAAELAGKFYIERTGLSVEALSTNTSVLTALGNDYSFDEIFSRQIIAKGNSNDVFVGISTSGNSNNLLEALRICKDKKINTIVLTGQSGGLMSDLSDICIKVNSNDTPRIQEAHILIGHIICEIVESKLF